MQCSWHGRTLEMLAPGPQRASVRVSQQSTQCDKAGRSAWTGLPDITLRQCRKSCNDPITRLQDPTGTGTGAEQAGERQLVALPTSQLCALRSAVLVAPGCAASPAATLSAVFSGLGGSLGTLTLRPPRPRPLGALSAFSSREKGLSTAGFLAAGATTRLENALFGTWNPSILTFPELGREVPCSMVVLGAAPNIRRMQALAC